MGRPKGSTDSKPRKRRGSLTKGAALPAPKKLAERSRKIKAQIKAIARDLVLNDWYIKIGLGVSGIQLAVTFTYITPSPFASAFSILSAIGKAAFIEGGVWLMNRAFSHVRATARGWGSIAAQAFIIVVVFTLMVISANANVQYEWEKRVLVKYPKGECVSLKKDKVTCSKYEPVTVNETNVNKYLSKGEQSESTQRGGLIPLLVFAAIIIGRIMNASKDGFEADELRRLRESERGFEYRERKAVAVRERVKKAEDLGLEAAGSSEG